MKVLHIKVAVVLLICLLLAAGAFSQQKADILIVHARVVTLDDSHPRAEAVAIVGNKIIAVGSEQEMDMHKGKTTKVIDAKGHTVIPGLFDSHLHVIRGGRFYNAELRWDGVKTLKRALQMLKEQARRTPPGQWVRVVGGWSEYQFTEKRLPTLQEINEATGTVPTFILYLYGKAWVNKAGLKSLNISSETPNPPGGLVEKDSEGNPTGLLVAEPNAYVLYSTLAKLPELTMAERFNSTVQFMSELNRLGITAAMDAGGGFQNFPEDYAVTDSLNKLGKITIRLPYFLFAQKKGSELADFSKWISMVEPGHLSSKDMDIVNYRIFGGGENIVSEAADFENFLFPRPEFTTAMEGSLKPVLQLLVKNRWPFRIHATYNESITRDLDVIEEVNKETPLNGLIWFFDHAETISRENLLRIKALGGGIAIQHRMAFQGESFIQRYGKKAAFNTPPAKAMLELKLPVGLGTDGTRVATYNPWVALYWITTGRTVGGTQVTAQEYLLDRFTALRLYTSGSYSLIKEEHTKGKIKEGYFADLVMLNKDYFTVPDEEIKSITSLLTITDGKVVWGAGEYAGFAPKPVPAMPAWSPVRHFGGYQDK
jgi:predicted amidohydrolase YtcJ